MGGGHSKDTGASCDCKCLNKIFLKSCENNEVDKVIACTTLQVDINCKDDQHFSGLHYSAWNDHLAILVYLLGKPNIDVNALTLDSETPLMAACKRGHGRIVRKVFIPNRNNTFL